MMVIILAVTLRCTNITDGDYDHDGGDLVGAGHRVSFSRFGFNKFSYY